MTAIFLLVCACATTTQVTSDWKDEAYLKKPEKIVVLALLNDSPQRRMMEDELTSQLKAAGIDAIAGYTVVPEGRAGDKELMAATVRELGADALFMTRLVDRKTVQEYVPGTPYYPPLSYHDWYSYYGNFSSSSPPYGYAPAYPPGNAMPSAPRTPPAYSPGYTKEVVYDIAEANLYDAATGKIVWSARTESRMHENDEKAVKSYASEIIKSLRKRNLVP